MFLQMALVGNQSVSINVLAIVVDDVFICKCAVPVKGFVRPKHIERE